METYRKPDQILLGSLITIISYFCVALMGTFVQMVPPSVGMGKIVFFQYLVSLSLCLPHLFIQGISSLKTSRFPGHLFRDLVGVTTFGLYFLSLSYTSLTKAVVLRSTTPFWIPIILFLWRRDRIPFKLWIVIFLGFLGVLLIVKPSGADSSKLGFLFAIGSGFFMALAALAIRRLSATEPPQRTMFYYFLIASLTSLPFALFHWEPYSWSTWLLLIAIGILMYIVQYTLILAFQYAKASRLAPMSYTAIVFSALLDWWLKNQFPDLLTICGILLVVGLGILGIIFERQNEKIIS